MMRSSKMSSSNMSTKFIDDCCNQHGGEPFVNFCSSMSCVKPLCAECIENHYTYHKNLRTAPEIVSFKSLKNQCITKIGDMLDRLGAQQNQMSMNQLHQIFQTSLKKIKDTRDHCRKVVDSYFHNLQDYVRKRMERMASDQSQLFVELQKASNIVSELKALCNRLQNTKTFLPTAEVIVKLDSDKVQESVKKGYMKVNDLKQQHRVNLQIQKNYQQKLVSFLSKIAYYGNFQNLQTMPKVAEELITKNHLQNLSRSRSKQKMMSPNFNDQGNNTLYRSRPAEKSIDKDDDRRSTLTRKSSSKSIKGSAKQIIGMNTFKQNAPRKFLHFFQNDQNVLNFLDLQDGQKFQSINLNLNFKIPDFHKSIATPNGDLYLIGGSLSDNGQKSQKIYKYDFTNKNLTYCASLKYGRSSHSVCFNTKYIYVMGGFLNNQEITNRCERFDISTNKVQQIRPMNYGACSFACCSFNGRYIYKFGGVGDQNIITYYIEMFDEKTGQWSIVNPSMQVNQGKKLVPLSTSSAVQITQSEMMVLGGYDSDNSGHKQTYILKVSEDGTSTIRDINSFPLPFAQGFWNNTPIIHKKLVFVLQNISYNNDECSQNQRRILIFDGKGWKVID